MFKYNCKSPVPVRDNKGYINYYPCGKCRNCLNKRSSVYSKLINYEIATHKYNYFITLTYDNKSIPKLLIDYRNGYANLIPDWDFINPITGEYNEVFFKVNSNDYVKLNSVIQKTSSSIFTQQYIPTLRYSDVQKFLKRIRTNSYRFAKKCDEFVKPYDVTFKFFVLCEYGSEGLRPHYHLLLHTNSHWLGDYFRGVLKESKRASGKLDIEDWQYGFIDFKCIQDSGYINSYLASYVSMANNISDIYTHRVMRQKVFHSKHYGDFYADNRNYDLYLLSTMSVEDFFSVSNITPFGIFKPSQSYHVVNSVYPKLPYAEEFNSFDLHSLLNLIRKNVYTKTSRFAEILADDLIYSDHSDFIPKLTYDNIKRVLEIGFNRNIYRFAYKYNNLKVYKYEFFESVIRRYLYASLNWCRYHSDSFFEIDKYLKFYDYRAMKALDDFYTNQEVYYNQYRFENNDLCFWYRNLPRDGSITDFVPSSSPIQMSINSYQEDLYKVRSLQKIHNDKNKLLN